MPNNKRNTGLVLFILGLAAALFGRQLFGNLIEDFSNGIGVTFKKIRFNYSLTSPTTINLLLDVKIRNSNIIGGTVSSFNSSLRFGKDGIILTSIINNGFVLPANGEVNTTFTAPVELLAGSQAVKNVWQQVVSGSLKKLFVQGTLNTNFGSIPIEQEVSIFEV